MQTYLFPIRILLEQGVKESIVPGLRFFKFAWQLMGIVISNTNRGQNIIELSSPVKQIRVKFFDELTSKNFTVYSQMEDIKENEDIICYGLLYSTHVVSG